MRKIIIGATVIASAGLFLWGWPTINRPSLDALADMTSLKIPSESTYLEFDRIRDEIEPVFVARLALPITGREFCINNNVTNKKLELWPELPTVASYAQIRTRPVECVLTILRPKETVFFLVVDAQIIIYFVGN